MKNQKELLKDVETLYSENIRKHGLQSKSVGWNDNESQITRFHKLTHSFELAQYTKSLTFNDLGCGYGEMFKFLKNTQNLSIQSYYGYDISQEMLQAAQDHITDKEVRWFNDSQISTIADYTFVSGTFNVRFAASDDEWQEYILKTLRMMDDFSTEGFSFNLLSTYVDWKEKHLYYGDPLFYFDFCKKMFSRYVTLYHDYPLYEWTIVVNKSVI